MITSNRVGKWGNSLAIRIPRSIAEQCGVQKGSAIEVKAESRKIVISKREYDLAELLSQVTDENRHQEVDWGPSQGRELW